MLEHLKSASLNPQLSKAVLQMQLQATSLGYSPALQLLHSLERQLDAAIAQKHAAVQEAVHHPPRVKKRLRVFVHNTHAHQGDKAAEDESSVKGVLPDMLVRGVLYCVWGSVDGMFRGNDMGAWTCECFCPLVVTLQRSNCTDAYARS